MSFEQVERIDRHRLERCGIGLADRRHPGQRSRLQPRHQGRGDPVRTRACGALPQARRRGREPVAQGLRAQRGRAFRVDLGTRRLGPVAHRTFGDAADAGNDDARIDLAPEQRRLEAVERFARTRCAGALGGLPRRDRRVGPRGRRVRGSGRRGRLVRRAIAGRALESREPFLWKAHGRVGGARGARGMSMRPTLRPTPAPSNDPFRDSILERRAVRPTAGSRHP